MEMRDQQTRHETEQEMCRICLAHGNKTYITVINETCEIKVPD